MTSLSAETRTAESLAGHTTLRLGGPAARYVAPGTSAEIVAAITAADAAGEPVLVLGGGSNLVISDDGFPGTVIKIANLGSTIDFLGDAKVLLTAEAGEDWDTVVAGTVAAGLGGLECLSGIPGYLGATPVQNVGAYGVEVSQLLVSVDLLDRRSGEVHTVPAADLGLDYRTSMLKGTDAAVVLRARFELADGGLSAPVRYAELAGLLGVHNGERVPVEAARQAVLELRRGKGMVLDPADHDTWSAGSFFTNPVLTDTELAGVRARRPGGIPQIPVGPGRWKVPAAWLIEHAGFAKGHPGPGGRVTLSGKHALALTNRGGATTADLLTLAREVREGVRAVFGVELRPEPVLVGCSL